MRTVHVVHTAHSLARVRTIHTQVKNLLYDIILKKRIRCFLVVLGEMILLAIFFPCNW